MSTAPAPDKSIPLADRPLMVPFTILVDSAEQQPFLFQGLRADARQNRRPLQIFFDSKLKPGNWRYECLGRHPNSLGDYSIDGFVGQIHIERKSIHDAHGTILGWDGRRERFEQELTNLSAVECAVVLVECPFDDLWRKAPEPGTKSAAANAKTIFQSVLAWQQDYAVQWHFAGCRRSAEIYAFRFLERFWRKHKTTN